MKTYKQFKKELLKDTRVKESYSELGPEFEIISLLIKKRMQGRLTQRELAKRVGTKQSAISRLESGTYNPTISFLYRVADALDARIKVSIGLK